MSKKNPTITVVAYPDRGAGSDPIFFFFFFLPLCQGGYVFGSVGLSVCLFICLFVDNITQKVMNGWG